MNTQAECLRAWSGVHRKVSVAGAMVTIPKSTLFPHPRDAGALPTAHWPVGQTADYVLEFGLGVLPLFVREFSDRYEAFVQGVRFTAEALRLIERNPQQAMFVGGTLVGAAIGTAIGRNKQSALAGAGLGLLITVLINSSMQRRIPPPRAQLMATSNEGRCLDAVHGTFDSVASG